MNILVVRSLPLLITVSFQYISRIWICKARTKNQKVCQVVRLLIQIDTLSYRKHMLIYRPSIIVSERPFLYLLAHSGILFYFVFFAILVREIFISIIGIYISVRLYQWYFYDDLLPPMWLSDNEKTKQNMLDKILSTKKGYVHHKHMIWEVSWWHILLHFCFYIRLYT